MVLTRLIYASRPAKHLTPEDAGQILDVSRRNNARDGITGLLCFNQHYFFQCLEGGRQIVNTTYHRIAHDDRHNDILLISYVEADERMFSEWKMAYVHLDDTVKESLFAYHATVEFNPYDISMKSADKMMIALSKSLSAI